MKHYRWQIMLGIILISLSAVLYLIHYVIFRDLHHIAIYMLGDIAFVPIEVLLVTLIIHRFLSQREKKVMLKKLNMVIGVFFSEAGTELLKLFSCCNLFSNDMAVDLLVNNQWTENKFLRIIKQVSKRDYHMTNKFNDLPGLKKFLLSKRDFFLGLLENPNLLEHDSFTELLWAVFHLTEELAHRQDLSKLSENDYLHVAGDIKRVYSLLVFEWLTYMKHLKTDYPYLFSLAVRTNPFNPNAAVEVP